MVKCTKSMYLKFIKTLPSFDGVRILSSAKYSSPDCKYCKEKTSMWILYQQLIPCLLMVSEVFIQLVKVWCNNVALENLTIIWIFSYCYLGAKIQCLLTRSVLTNCDTSISLLPLENDGEDDTHSKFPNLLDLINTEKRLFLIMITYLTTFLAESPAALDLYST